LDYFSRVYNYVCYRLADADSADDVTAQIFERTLTSIGHYQPERVPFAAWLFAIARYAVSDHLRTERRRRWLSLDALRDQPDGEPQPEQVAIQDEARLMLLASESNVGVTLFRAMRKLLAELERRGVKP
jgi:RNA polymerase sigma-70 factor (ECF subfamily)